MLIPVERYTSLGAEHLVRTAVNVGVDLRPSISGTENVEVGKSSRLAGCRERGERRGSSSPSCR